MELVTNDNLMALAGRAASRIFCRSADLDDVRQECAIQLFRKHMGKPAWASILWASRSVIERMVRRKNRLNADAMDSGCCSLEAVREDSGGWLREDSDGGEWSARLAERFDGVGGERVGDLFVGIDPIHFDVAVRVAGGERPLDISREMGKSGEWAGEVARGVRKEVRRRVAENN